MSTIDFAYLRHLAIFCVVAEQGSFAAAARVLHSSRSRVSEQVADLEGALGSRLLQRSTRQLTLTEEGNRVYEKARMLQEVLQDIDSITTAEQPAGRVAITANHDIAHKFVLPALVAFKQLYPDIYIDFLASDERIDLIHDKVDLAVRIGIPKDASLIARVLHEETFTLYAQPELLKRYGYPENIEALATLPWVLLDLPNWNNSVRLYNESVTRVVTPKHYHRCNSPMMIHRMAATGMGVALFLPSTVADEIKAGLLEPVLPAWTGERMAFSLVYPSRKNIPQRTRVLIDYLADYEMFK
ncbi:LysR family transcriptional regulator [Alteromonas sp. 1_MG-2023]|uniref:LysR family transcriptional regulator n=1 Tax=Alteromonas sp. 1_MG-2023 TaxID=3062669 RepID=UPI0026E4717D|nr:LysR family transcriptional regulator [Alteromonas sp. 1_MG-2023]MDO6477686.1 LysR family transcriptional regulator [Alteromonas sp. 1_MG-2023]